MLLPASGCILSVIGRCLGDAVERQVVHVDVAVGATPGEGERGGVGRSDGEVTDCSRTCRRKIKTLQTSELFIVTTETFLQTQQIKFKISFYKQQSACDVLIWA